MGLHGRVAQVSEEKGNSLRGFCWVVIPLVVVFVNGHYIFKSLLVRGGELPKVNEGGVFHLRERAGSAGFVC